MMLKQRLFAVYRWLNGISVRYKILGLALSLIFLLGFVLTVQMRLIQEETLREELQQQGVALTRDMAARVAEFVLLDDLYSLHSLLMDTQSHAANVRYAFVLDADGVALAYTFRGGFPHGLLEANDVDLSARYHIQRLETNEGVIWDVAAPILSGVGGVARLGISEAGLHDTVGKTTGQFILTTAGVALLGMAIALFLTLMITRPINQLVHAAEAVSAEEYTVHLEAWGDDEIGTLAKTFNQMIEELARAAQERAIREQQRGLLIDKIYTAQEEERRRIARELHDDTGQALTAIRMGLTNTISMCGLCRERGRLDELYTLTGDTLTNVRQLALELHPPVLDDLGLVAATRRYVQEWGNTYHISASFEAVGMEGTRFDQALETAIYRIIQEALTNVARHANASNVGVILACRRDTVVAIVEDNGIGFDPAVAKQLHSLGLQGMKERASLVHGHTTIESSPGNGTTVFLRVPLEEPQTQLEGSSC